MAPCIGLISRTGMDAVDTALVALGDDGGSTVATRSASNPEDLKSELHALGPSGTAIGFWNVDARPGMVFANATLDLGRERKYRRAAR